MAELISQSIPYVCTESFRAPPVANFPILFSRLKAMMATVLQGVGHFTKNRHKKAGITGMLNITATEAGLSD